MKARRAISFILKGQSADAYSAWVSPSRANTFEGHYDGCRAYEGLKADYWMPPCLRPFGGCATLTEGDRIKQRQWQFGVTALKKVQPYQRALNQSTFYRTTALLETDLAWRRLHRSAYFFWREKKWVLIFPVRISIKTHFWKISGAQFTFHEHFLG